MNSPVTHWGTREWQGNQDVLAADPAHPKAVPAQVPTDLKGQIRAWLAAEDGNLVAYGFGGQRVVLPRDVVGAVHTVTSFRVGRITRGRALLVLDHDKRILLRASGLWETYGEVSAVCRAARVPKPTYVAATTTKVRTVDRNGRKRTRSTGKPVPPQFKKAPGYCRLRVRPRGTTVRVLALLVLFTVTTGLCVSLGVTPAVLLPQWFGAVRTLIGIIGVVAGGAVGLWAGGAIAQVLADGVRWAVSSRAVGALAPLGRFFRRRERSRVWSVAWSLAMTALIPALVYWGPGVGLASLAHGFRDSALVTELRAQGAQVRGELIDVPEYGTDDNGNDTVTDVPTLAFENVETTDPSIGGRPLPLDSDDPMATADPETIVFLPSDPDTAATAQQISGSAWHGAPTANLISGGLLTLALPPALWFLVLRIRRRRFLPAKNLVEDLGA
jgi:hypothetical protein